jgi:hypothetical protein
MLVLDRRVLFSNDQAITASANSTDIIDLSSLRDISSGEPVIVLVQVTEAFDALTSLTITIQTSTTEAFSVPVSLTAATLPLSSLTAGEKFLIIALPGGILRYLRLAYTVSGSTPTVGRIIAGLARCPSTRIPPYIRRCYPAAV